MSAALPAPAIRRVPKCRSCGSASVVCDASADWNVDTQQWELSNTYDAITCNDCGAFRSWAKWVEVLGEADMGLTNEDEAILKRQHGSVASIGHIERHLTPHSKDIDVMAMSMVGDPRGPLYHNAVRAGWGLSETEFQGLCREVLP